MGYLGSWKVDDLLTFPAVTHRADTGVLTDADAVPAYRIYEDETATPLLTGNMAKLDDANTTGFYSEQITLSAANGFEKGKCYTVYITATVNGILGGTFHAFQIEAEVDANVISDVAGIRSAVGLSAANLDAQLSAIDDFLDTEIAAVKTQTDKLTFDGGNHIVADMRKISTSATAADSLEEGGLALVVSTCAAGSTTTSVVTNLTEATNDHLNGRVITFTSGALAGQTSAITDYNGGTKTLTVVALTEAPVDTDRFVIS